MLLHIWACSFLLRRSILLYEHTVVSPSFLLRWTFGLFPFGAIMNKAAMHTWVQVCVNIISSFSVFDSPFPPMWPEQGSPYLLRDVAWGLGEHKVLRGQGEAMGVLAAVTPEPVESVPGLALEFPPAPGKRQ